MTIRVSDDDGVVRPGWREKAEHMMREALPIVGILSEENSRFLQQQCEWAARFGSGRNSPVVSLLMHVGNYWRSAFLLLLRLGPLRPSQLRAIINGAPAPPLSKRILTLNLRALEQDGLIEREIYSTGQAHVEYRLTELGRQLSEMMVAITELGVSNVGKIIAARQAFEEDDRTF